MGNCMETCNQQPTKEMFQYSDHQKEERTTEAESRVLKKSRLGKSTLRVKIVLTKQELDWFMIQLIKDHKGDYKSLEDVLVEIERRRAKVELWKPSLETVMECPEVVEMDRS